MSLWVKICGNTTLADAQLAAEAGADAVGFVFAPSPRRVSAEQTAEIVAQLPTSIEKIGVFVDADFGSIAATVEACRLTGVQLHFGISQEASSQLRRQFGPSLRILRVVHFDASSPVAPALQAAKEESSIDAVLVDSRVMAAVGGTGIPFDWRAARETIFTGDSSINLIAAGGLTPANVAEAIAILRPWGVDVASGVEATPGCKDPAKVRAFVECARGQATIHQVAKPDAN